MSDTVLLAEDDDVLRGVYLKRLATKGYHVMVAADGEEALRIIEREAPALFICDIQMPKSDAFHVLSSLPREKRTFPVILLTNFDQDDFREKARALGADGYMIKKDMTLNALVKEIERLLKK